MPPTLVAPISPATSRIFSTWRGLSLIPGMSGAIRIPDGMPARLSSPTAASRVLGCGVCGSVARQAFSSSVGTDRFATNSVRFAISLKMARSRRSSGDLVRTEHGFEKSRIASQIPGISL